MKSIIQTLAVAALLAGAVRSQADVTVGVDPSATWLGFMNVNELPSNGGGYVFGSGWGTADLRANFSGNILTLEACGVLDHNAFWYVDTVPPTPAPGPGGPGVPGNKIMEANFYVESNGGALAGQTVTFTGQINSNNLTGHTTVAFVKDFAANYSSSVTSTVPVVNGTFTVSLATINDPARHIQYGFQTVGVNCWPTDVSSFGKIEIQSLPVVPPNPDKTVDPLAGWQGYMNQFELPENGGAPFAQGTWGVPDLKAVFTPGTLTLSPNSIEPVTDPDHYEPDEVTGNKIMEANMYVETATGVHAGQTVTFSGTVVSNTLTGAHTAVAFIKDFAPDYSSFVETSVALAPGAFNLSLPAINDPLRHVQYGFQMKGVNVAPSVAGDFGNIVISTGGGPVDPFTTWIGTYDFSAYPGANLTKAGDPDGDGLNNLAEFALNNDPTNGSAPGNVRSRVETVSGEQALVITLPVRDTASFSGSPSKSATVDGMVYTIEGTNGLINFDQGVTEVTPASTANPAMPILDTPGWTYHTFRLNGAVGGGTPRGPQGFLRARIAPAAP